MDDVRKAAAERAARSKRNPIGAGFESERQREKNALVRQLDAQDGRNVHTSGMRTAGWWDINTGSRQRRNNIFKDIA